MYLPLNNFIKSSDFNLTHQIKTIILNDLCE